MDTEIETKLEYRFTFVDRDKGGVRAVFGPDMDKIDFFLECYYPNQPKCQPSIMEMFTGLQVRKILKLREKWVNENCEIR